MTGLVLLAVAGAVLLAELVTVGWFMRRLGPGRVLPRTIGEPRLTLLRPVCGRDPFDAETLGTSFTQDYPAYEIIFCAPSETDPAVPLVRALMAANPGIPAQVLTGETPISGNPKLNNLWKGWQAVTTDWVCMTDSNLLLPPDYLRTVAASWGPKTGIVSSPPYGIWPEGLAGSLECAILNGNQARMQFASDSIGMAFAQGKTLFWNRGWLEQQGGLAALGRYMAEDVNATKLVRAAGLKVSLTPLPFAQPIGRRTFAQVWSRQLRWSRVRRDGFPIMFMTEVMNGSVPGVLALGLGALFGLLPWALLPGFLVIWYGAEVVLMRRAGWPRGWRDIVVLPVRDLLLPALWAATFLSRGIEWRGTAMVPQGQAAPAGAAGAPAVDKEPAE
jgi:ceramide glucosyltransferase